MKSIIILKNKNINLMVKLTKIALFVYNRLDHTYKVIKNLKIKI